MIIQYTDKKGFVTKQEKVMLCALKSDDQFNIYGVTGYNEWIKSLDIEVKLSNNYILQIRPRVVKFQNIEVLKSELDDRIYALVCKYKSSGMIIRHIQSNLDRLNIPYNNVNCITGTELAEMFNPSIELIKKVNGVWDSIGTMGYTEYKDYKTGILAGEYANVASRERFRKFPIYLFNHGYTSMKNVCDSFDIAYRDIRYNMISRLVDPELAIVMMYLSDADTQKISLEFVSLDGIAYYSTRLFGLSSNDLYTCKELVNIISEHLGLGVSMIEDVRVGRMKDVFAEFDNIDTANII